jgi:lipopolysaccharide/colanic/teichoic acid biosynthesis glycosyltransferase
MEPNILINKDYQSLAQYLNMSNSSEGNSPSTHCWTVLRESELLSIFKTISNSETMNLRRELLSQEQFRTLVLHECARCDRNYHQFSLIQIDLQNDPGKKALKGLIKNVLKRIRTTDEAGWLSKTSLGIFLPETSREGANIFAAAVCDNITYQIYTYPDPSSSDRDNQSPSDRRKTEDHELDRDHSEDSPGEGMDVHDQTFQMSRTAVTQELETIVHSKGLPAWKRIIDVFGSFMAIVLFCPLFILIAVYIKLVSRGPILYRQERVGYLGHPFTILKFRTMKANADCDIHRSHLKKLINGDKVLTKLDQETDCRWIPLAGLIRKTCLDELPQLLNVLKGEMSLVGPRPVLFYEAEEYSLWQRQRFHAVPGMTGLWQVSGKNRLTFSQMMRLDARYSKKCNFLLDLLIFIKTIPAILRDLKDSVRDKLTSHPQKERVSIWKRPLSDLVRQLFL